MAKEEFTNAGFTVVRTEDNENKLFSFLKENYPSIIRDNEINIEQMKAVLGLPIDENIYMIVLFAILFGIYIIYRHNLKTKTPM